MDYKFRPNNGGDGGYYVPPPPPPPPESSSSLGYFAEQALRGYMHPDLPRPGDYFPNPRKFPDNVLREIEKQKIREEMIAAEVERRRELEAEVRREMMIEREMALRSGHPHNFPFSGAPETLNPRVPMFNYPESRFGDGSPFSRKSEIRITELKATPELNKERIVILPKPGVNISGNKRNQVAPPATNLTISSSNPNKKFKETLSCEVCHVKATSEQALKEHLQGKKHKSREAKLPSHIAGKNFAIGLFSRKPPTKDGTSAIQKKQKKEEVSSELVEEEGGDVVLQKGEESLDGKNHDVGKKKKKDSLKFSFWCEMCKIGAFSKKVMNAHMKGKKHTSRVLDDLGVKKENVEEMAVRKEIIEAKQDIDVGNKKSKEMVKPSAENNEKEDVDEVVVNSESDRVVSPLRIGWIE